MNNAESDSCKTEEDHWRRMVKLENYINTHCHKCEERFPVENGLQQFRYAIVYRNDGRPMQVKICGEC